MNQNKDTKPVIDHLFRHQFGKMVSILCRVFGLQHLETIEDAIQDTFMKAAVSWRDEIPENPEAWLTAAAKNRTIDLFRQLKSEKERAKFIENGTSSIAFSELFLADEIADSQLRMIFTACHPALDPRDQIAFALKTIAGFSQKEIAAALLLQLETTKKRLSRARASIQKEQLVFEIPQGEELKKRRIRVLEVLYLLFNEGFHSSKKEMIVRQDICGEAMRLCKMLVDHPKISDAETEALLALMCFHAARLESKINDSNEIIDLRLQDRSKWYFPLIVEGNTMMAKATRAGIYSPYHYEAAIACEHLMARKFEDTDWQKILFWYEKLQAIAPSPFNLLNMAVVNLQDNKPVPAKTMLDAVKPKELGQREYLHHGCMAQYYKTIKDYKASLSFYDKALATVHNNSERVYLTKKREKLVALMDCEKE